MCMRHTPSRNDSLSLVASGDFSPEHALHGVFFRCQELSFELAVKVHMMIWMIQRLVHVLPKLQSRESFLRN